MGKKHTYQKKLRGTKYAAKGEPRQRREVRGTRCFSLLTCLLLITSYFSLLTSAFAQVPYSELVGSTGHDTTVGGMHLSYSVGEPMVQTWSSGAVTITQGFQQPTPNPLSCSLVVSINAVAIAGGGNHSLALKSDGTVWAWGLNISGQLGNGTNTDSWVPVQVIGLTGITAIAGGQNHSIALKNDGTVWAWGYNGDGSLGNGTFTNSNVPVQVTGLTGIIAIAGGYYHSLALKNDGTVRAWGKNLEGQLGNGTFTNSNVPVPVSSLTAVTAIAGGYYHSLALKNDGTVRSWGLNTSGQLGNGTFTNSNVPVPVTGLTAVTSIAGGGAHSLALRNDGTVRAWGKNLEGQLGNGTFTNSNVPVLVSSLTAVTAIAGGYYHSLALKNDGTVRAWGKNLEGQLGNGTFTNSNIPVTVSSLTAITAIAGGQDHSLALKNDGTVRSWGLNTSGQLGNGTFTNSNVPVQVTPFSTGICLGESVTLTATVSNGVAPYTYLWSTGATTDTLIVNPTITTTYSVVASDTSCSDTAYVTVLVDSLPTISITSSPNDSICAGGNVVLIANGGFTYVWSTGATTTLISDVPSSTTTYTVTGKSVNGCGNTDTLTVTVISQPTVNAGADQTVCTNNSAITLSGSSSSGNGIWTGGDGTFSPDNITLNATYAPGANDISSGSVTISLTSTNNGPCAAAGDAMILTINPTPTVTVTNPQTICSGTNVTLSASGATTYSWSTTAITSSITVSPTAFASYSVIGTSGTCSDTATTSVTVYPTPNVTLSGGNTTICLGQTTTLTASGGGTYLWSNGPTAPVNIITPSSTGTVTYSVTVTIGSCQVDTSISITVNPSPTASISSQTNASCFAICNGDATVTASGGTLPYTYLWNDPGSQTTPTASGLCAGNYTSTVTDQSGCSVTNTVLITQPAAFSTTVSATSACNSTSNGTTSVSVTGGVAPYSFVWSTSPIQTTSAATNLSAGNYTVVITDANGCTGSDTVTVASATVTASITASATTICSGSNTTLTASGGSVYTWSSGQNSSVIIVSPANTTAYTATVTTASGCSDIDSITVNVTTAPIASITITPSSTICSGTTITLSASGGTTYSWQSTQTTGTNPTVVISPNTSFTYTLVAYNGSCTDTIVDSIVVTTVSASISGTDTVCVGGTITLNASSNGTIYSWSGPNSFSSTLQNITITNATTSSAGTYTVIASDATGCSGVATISVSVNPLPTPAITTTTTSICAGYGSATLTASGGNTYFWSTTATTTSIIVSSWFAGNYNYTVTAYNGLCSADTFITITVLPLPAIQVTSSDTTVCPGDAVTLTASIPSGALGYQWTGYLVNQNPIVVTPIVSSTYTVIGMGLNGCANQTVFTEIISTVSVDAGSDQTICFGFTAQLDATVSGNVISYLWSPASSLNNTTVSNPSANPDTNTVYFVEVYNSDMCYAKDSVTVFIIRSSQCLVYVYNGITPNGDGNNDVWFIDGIQSFPDNNVSIFNRWGAKVWGTSHYDNKERVWKGDNQQGNPLPDGTYYYIIEIHEKDGTDTRSGWVEVTH